MSECVLFRVKVVVFQRRSGEVFGVRTPSPRQRLAFSALAAAAGGASKPAEDTAGCGGTDRTRQHPQDAAYSEHAATILRIHVRSMGTFRLRPEWSSRLFDPRNDRRSPPRLSNAGRGALRAQGRRSALPSLHLPRCAALCYCFRNESPGQTYPFCGTSSLFIRT